MSEPTSEQGSDPEVAQDVAAAGATDEPVHNLTVEDDPQGTTDPTELAGSSDEGTA